MIDDTRDPETGLTHPQERAMAALLTEPSVAKAAETAQVAESRLHAWLRQDRFGGEYRRRRREVFSQAISLAQRYAPLALQTLAKALVDPQAPYPARVAAAKGILNFARESIELDELTQRLEAIEQQLAGSGGRGPVKPVVNSAEQEEPDGGDGRDGGAGDPSVTEPGP